jgi:hypothetical protein
VRAVLRRSVATGVGGNLRSLLYRRRYDDEEEMPVEPLEQFVVASVFAVSFVSMGVLLVTFGRLVWLEYRYHREAWEDDGRPVVGPPYPPETWALPWLVVRSSSVNAGIRCMVVWFFSTPEWMKRDRRALRWVPWFRVLAFTFAVSSFTFLALDFFSTVLLRLHCCGRDFTDSGCVEQ